MKEPIGVLHLVHQFGPGGAEGQFIARLRAHPEGFRPVVACLQKAGPLLEAVQQPVEEFALRGGLARIDTAQVILRLAAFMEREGVRLVHANDHYSNLLAVPAAKLVRAKVICSRIDLRQWAFRAQRLAEALALRGADAVMVNARCLRETCVHEDGVRADKVYVVHNGVDLAAFDCAAKKGAVAAALVVLVLMNLLASSKPANLLSSLLPRKYLRHPSNDDALPPLPLLAPVPAFVVAVFILTSGTTDHKI